MKNIHTILIATTLGIASLGLAGCSEESQNKWEKAGKAVGDAAKETAQEAKEGAQEVIKNAKATDPDTGMAK